MNARASELSPATTDSSGPRRSLRHLARALACLAAAAGFAAGAGTGAAQDAADPETAPPAAVPAVPSVEVVDAPNDDGERLLLRWPAAEGANARLVLARAESPEGPFVPVDTVALAAGAYTDDGVERGQEVYYQVRTLSAGGVAAAPIVLGPFTAAAEWFNTGRTSVFVFSAAFFGLVIFFLLAARGGRSLFVRRIPGIDAIEEAVGRATEMGRPVLYVPGIQDVDDIQTLASLVILESVSRMTAEYETRIIVPVNYPVVMTLAQEMVKNGHLQAGRPDAYDDTSVRYVTTEQFAYVAAVNGIMLRDKPAANIFLGPFFAESLILAETGYMTKAIQVAGTANVHQLPFFVVACDYTLIGEELYAASAYLSKEPRQLSTLKGSDYMKVLIIAVLLLGSVLESVGVTGLTTWMQSQ